MSEEIQKQEEEEVEGRVELTFHSRSGRAYVGEMPLSEYLNLVFEPGWAHCIVNWISEATDVECWLEVYERDIEAITVRSLD